LRAFEKGALRRIFGLKMKQKKTGEDCILRSFATHY
jgi:hypothetical protein